MRLDHLQLHHLDGAPRWEVVREEPPGAPGTAEVADGVDDLPHVDGSRPTAGPGRGNEGCNPFPLSIGEIAEVRSPSAVHGVRVLLPYHSRLPLGRIVNLSSEGGPRRLLGCRRPVIIERNSLDL